MTKSLGQVAYEAWAVANIEPDDWSELFEDEQASWEAAAQAVVAAGLDHMSDTVEADRLLPTERKVIEAAKAHIAATGVSEDSEATTFEALHEAVEALQGEE